MARTGCRRRCEEALQFGAEAVGLIHHLQMVTVRNSHQPEAPWTASLCPDSNFLPDVTYIRNSGGQTPRLDSPEVACPAPCP